MPADNQKKPTPMQVSIDDIQMLTSVQMRVTQSNPVISEYSELMQAGVTFPPVIVFRNHQFNNLILADGFHRIYAMEDANISQVSVLAYDGDADDAIRYALGANADHGLQRTRADKIKAVEAAIELDHEYSDRAIAAMCHVSHPFVSRIRKELEATGDIEPTTSRTGVDGKSYVAKNLTDDDETPDNCCIVESVNGKKYNVNRHYADNDPNLCCPECGLFCVMAEDENANYIIGCGDMDCDLFYANAVPESRLSVALDKWKGYIAKIDADPLDPEQDKKKEYIYSERAGYDVTDDDVIHSVDYSSCGQCGFRVGLMTLASGKFVMGCVTDGCDCKYYNLPPCDTKEEAIDNWIKVRDEALDKKRVHSGGVIVLFDAPSGYEVCPVCEADASGHYFDKKYRIGCETCNCVGHLGQNFYNSEKDAKKGWIQLVGKIDAKEGQPEKPNSPAPSGEINYAFAKEHNFESIVIKGHMATDKSSSSPFVFSRPPILFGGIWNDPSSMFDGCCLGLTNNNIPYSAGIVPCSITITFPTDQYSHIGEDI